MLQKLICIFFSPQKSPLHGVDGDDEIESAFREVPGHQVNVILLSCDLGTDHVTYHMTHVVSLCWFSA